MIKAAQKKITSARKHPGWRLSRKDAAEGRCSDHGGKDGKEGPLFVRGAPARHKRQHAVSVLHIDSDRPSPGRRLRSKPRSMSEMEILQQLSPTPRLSLTCPRVAPTIARLHDRPNHLALPHCREARRQHEPAHGDVCFGRGCNFSRDRRRARKAAPLLSLGLIG